MQVPEGWKNKTIGDICKVVGGGTPSRLAPEYWNGTILWAGPTQITKLKTKYISSTVEKITQEGLDKSSAKLHPVDTVLMTSRASIGFTAINKVPMATNQGFQSLQCSNKVNNLFIHYFIQNNQKQLISRASGSTFLEISPTEVRLFPIPLPPLPEQEKIAEILSTCDDGIESTDKQIAKLKDLKKAMMQELLTKGIDHKEFKESPLGKIPKSWEVVSLNEVCKVNQGLQIPIEQRLKEPINGALRYITIQFIKSPNEVSNIFYIQNPKESVICFKEDILMTRTGNTGQIVTGEHGVFHNNFFKIAFDRNAIDKNFFSYFLHSVKTQKAISIYAGSTTIPDLNHGDFYRIQMQFPPLEEQKKIADILSSIDDNIESKGRKLSRLKDQKKALMNDLLTGKVRV